MQTAAVIIRKKNRHFESVQAAASVHEAIQIMAALNTGHLAVMDNEAYRGVFRERDYISKVILTGRDPRSCKVGDVLSPELPVTDAGANLETLFSMMHAHQTRILPVFDGRKFEGIITFQDALKAMLTARENIFGNGASPASTAERIPA